MQAAVMRSVASMLVVEDVVLDEPEPYEVVVRVEAAGVCHSDIGTWAGHAKTSVPVVLGHEPAGVVLAVGDRVTEVSVGDHVVGTTAASCGRCEYCVSGRPFLCGGRGTRRDGLGSGRLRAADGPLTQYAGLSAFAEQMLVHEGALVRIDDRVPFTVASLLGCGALTGLGAVFNTAGVRAGQTVAVIGLGGVGLAAVQAARIAGATQIVAVDSVPWKLEFAVEIGATDTVLAGNGILPYKDVLKMTGGGVDVAFECVGTPNTLSEAFSMTRTGGTTVLVGAFASNEMINLRGTDFIMRGKTLKGSSMGSSRPRLDIGRYANMYLDGRLKLDEMVSGTFGLADINAVFSQVLDGTVARGVLLPNS